ncbi:hypothetical protein O181_112352 [Austropuccinia psidii MF-1]|uniref:CCHC-type domain-containing protein n=1 Tax=Austropuccinia psidii MF-1 TaxID=1389203 RepID=A0A9Q3K1N7_9BASI|nr:hypothetical protein [Austropuccinia psidii MF-1]
MPDYTNNMIESKETSGDDMNVIMQLNRQAEIFERFISLAEKLRPQLRADGANFNLWSKNMIVVWTTYFMGDSDYFHQTNKDDNIKRNLVSRLFIEHSVSHNAYECVTSQIFTSDAHQIYHALKDRFNRPLWSLVVYHANILFKPLSDHSNDINNYAMSITEAVQNLENQLGQLDSEMITTLAIYFAVPSMHQLITPSINTLMATNPNLKVRPDNLLNIIQKITTASPSFEHSTEIAKPHLPSSLNSQETPKVPSSPFPCHYCGEVGHWSPNCPIKAKVNEARNKAPNQKAHVSGIGVVPTLEASEALLDSGAMHSVVGHLLLFTSLMLTNMTQSVASSKSFKVDAIGTIALPTSNGILQLNNVLYCCNIHGIVLYLGHLLKEHFLVSFSNYLFKISTPFQITTVKKDN